MADGAVQPGVGLTGAGIEEIWEKVAAARQESKLERLQTAQHLTKRAIELEQQEQQGDNEGAGRVWEMRRNLMD